MGKFNPTGSGGNLGGSLWFFLGSWGPKSGIWPVAVFWAPKALFGMLGPVPLADLSLPDFGVAFWVYDPGRFLVS